MLVIQKLDRLVLELKLPPQDAYHKLRHTIDEVPDRSTPPPTHSPAHLHSLPPLPRGACAHGYDAKQASAALSVRGMRSRQGMVWNGY